MLSIFAFGNNKIYERGGLNCKGEMFPRNLHIKWFSRIIVRIRTSFVKFQTDNEKMASSTLSLLSWQIDLALKVNSGRLFHSKTLSQSEKRPRFLQKIDRLATDKIIGKKLYKYLQEQ